MNFGKNLQFFRKMCNSMTQEALAEKLNVSRQTISKWELDTAAPEIDKVIELCELFNCSMDELYRSDMNTCDEAYSNIRTEYIDSFRYVRYTVISAEPEEDAIRHANEIGAKMGDTNPQVIGWDFPFLSQEQINVFHFHGYTAAWIVPDKLEAAKSCDGIVTQSRQKYAVITIKNPSAAPFTIIPNAYKTLMSYMKVNGIEHSESKEIISCFEKEYTVDGIDYMDIYIAAV